MLTENAAPAFGDQAGCKARATAATSPPESTRAQSPQDAGAKKTSGSSTSAERRANPRPRHQRKPSSDRSVRHSMFCTLLSFYMMPRVFGLLLGFTSNPSTFLKVVNLYCKIVPIYTYCLSEVRPLIRVAAATAKFAVRTRTVSPRCMFDASSTQHLRRGLQFLRSESLLSCFTTVLS